jgi:RHS repeat-associated protein
LRFGNLTPWNRSDCCLKDKVTVQPVASLPVMARSLCLLVCSLPFLFFAAASPAQDLPDVAQGLTPYVAYHGGQLDQVNTLNGSLTVRIPLVSYPQRGSLALSYSVLFNSFGFQDFSRCNASPSPGGPLHSGCTDTIQLMPTGVGPVLPGPHLVVDQALSAGGVAAPSNPTLPQTEDPLDGRFYVIGSDNSQHALAPTSGGYRSTDESGYLFVPSSPAGMANNNLGNYESAFAGDTAMRMGPAAGTITDSHGIAYAANTITDPDGNVITLPTTSSESTLDSADRTIPAPASASTSGCPTISSTLYPLMPYQSLSSAQSWVPPGSGTGYLFCYATVNIHTRLVILTDPGNGSSQLITQVQMLQSIVLPNGTFWGFVYDSNNPSSSTTPSPSNQNTGTGQLLTMIYPTGGSVNYTYAIDPGFCNSVRPNLGTNPAGVSILAYPAGVQTRTMNDAQGNILGEWIYGTSSGGTAGQFSVSVLSPTNSLTVTNYVLDTNSSSSCAYFEAGRSVYAGPTATGTPLLSTVKTYTFGADTGLPYASSPREQQTVTTLASGKTSTVQKQYAPNTTFFALGCDATGNNCVNDTSFSNPVGGPTKTTYIGYDHSIQKEESTPYQWQANSAYYNANLIDIPASTSILDGSGNAWQTTTYKYDEISYSPGGIRGHNTTTTGSLNVAGTAPTTHTGWSPTGMKSFVLDADANAGIAGHTNSIGHTIDYIYSPAASVSCNGSEVTSTVNALNQTTSGTYNCNTGLLNTLTDPNSKTTTVTWDSMRRLTGVTYPAISAGTPQTSFCYTDSNQICSGVSTPSTVIRTTLATPDPTQTLQVSFDAFGREIHRYTTDSPQNDTVDTTYDSDGRVLSVSNPYRTRSDSTYGLTMYTYDALNRKTVTQEPDGNTTITCYDGISSSAGQSTACSPNAISSVPNASWTDSLDETGRHWQHVSDSLGRLVAVMEPSPSTGALALQTQYSYDPLGNLLKVNQIGVLGETPHTRTFTYDSLSRLLCGANPENSTGSCPTSASSPLPSGVVSYGYDANGNLTSKTDARGITTSYTYDALNRLRERSYSDGVTNSVVYGYDGSSIGFLPVPSAPGRNLTASLTNTIGRMSFAAAVGPGSSGATSLYAYSYDAMGRLANLWVSTPSYNSGTSPVFPVSAKYDLAGNISDLTYPSGRHIHQAWNAAGELSSSTLADIGGVVQSPGQSYLTSASYFPDGSPSSLTLGNGVQQTFAKNNRLQVQSLAISNSLAPFSANGFLSHSYCYTGCTTGGTANNGNIWGITDTLKAANTQGFTYDSLNRIGSFSLGGAVNQQYSIDSFGNMSGMSGGTAISTFNPATNQISNLPCATSTTPYDAAGNQLCSTDTNGGISVYGYDAESRISQITALNSGASPFVNYTYDANGSRIRKTNATGTYTEYVGFGGQTLAERNSDGTWSDYIFANGQRIARADNFDVRVHLSGVNCSNCGSNPNMFSGTTSLAAESGYTIRQGDVLSWRQYQDGSALGGLFTFFTDGTSANGVATDTDGDLINADTTQNVWHERKVNLSAYAGKTIESFNPFNWTTAPAGAWDIYYGDIALISTDGSVIPIYNRSMMGLSLATNSTVANAAAITEDVPNSSNPATTNQMTSTTFYAGDHLGSAQMLMSAGGWPLESSQYMPFGGEITNSASNPNHYKFTGKERDTESGLDYFGARYYGSNMGRFMSPDWSAKAEPVPYSKLTDPQSLNLYSYVGNNPLALIDADGHETLHLCSGAEQGAGACGAGEVSTMQAAPPPQPQSHTQPAQQQSASPLNDKNGNAVQGANGKPALIPGGFDVNAVVQAGKDDKYMRSVAPMVGTADTSSDLANFRTGGKWDLQRLSGNFDPRFIDSATILIGMYAKAAGITRDQILKIQDDFAAAAHVIHGYPKNTPMSSTYTHLPVRNVTNTDIGMGLVQ